MNRRNVGARVTLALGITCVLGLVVSGCTADPGSDPGADADLAWLDENLPGLDPQLVEDACAVGKIVLYTPVFGGERFEPLVDKFTARFPCLSVEQYPASGGALAERFTSEARAGQTGADVFINTSPGLGNQLAAEGLFAEWEPPNADRVAEQFQLPGYWWTVGMSPQGYAWNADVVSDAVNEQLASITTWDELLALPEAPGPTGMINIRAGGSAQTPYYFLREEYGLDAWQTLEDTLDPTIYDGVFPLTERLTAGEVAFLPLVGSGSAPAEAWALGAPLRWRALSPGNASLFYAAIAENAGNPAAARLFIAWSISEEGQQSWNVDAYLSPVNSDIEDRRDFASEPWYYSPPVEEFQAVDYAALDADLDQLIADWDRIFG